VVPTPARTSVEDIVAAGQRVLESEGIDGLTMQRVATVVGVRAPSLYKHIAGRGELMRLIVEATVIELGRALESAVLGHDSRRDLAAIATAFRAFAHARPEAYRLIFAPLPDEWRPAPEVMRDAVAAVLRTAAGLAGPDHALEGARLVTAWGHGFLTMELAGAFRLEGDVDAAFAFGVERLAQALATSGRES
jgi:AcrR family transcriptional regulator